MSVFAILSSSSESIEPYARGRRRIRESAHSASLPAVGVDRDHEADHRDDDRGQDHPLGPVVDRLDARSPRRRCRARSRPPRRPPSPPCWVHGRRAPDAPRPARSRPVRPSRAAPSLGSVAQPCPLCDSTSPTTAPASRAGRRSPEMRTVQAELEAALERILGSPRPSRSRAGPTRGFTPGLRWRASRAGPSRPAELARALNSLTGHDLGRRGRGRPAGDFDARRDARSRTYCYRVLAERTPNPFEAGCRAPLAASGRPRRRSPPAPTPCRAPMTSRRSPRPRPSTSASSGTSCGRNGTRSRPCSARGGCSSSGSRPTPSCATWSGCWSGRCSRWQAAAAPSRISRTLLEGAPRERAGETARAHGLHLAAVRY